MSEVTAVQWLIHQLITENEVTLKGENYKLFEVAKEMEKEQIMDAFNKGNGWNYTRVVKKEQLIKGEQYYNETYKSE
jgi:ribosomal protein L23